MAHVTHLTDRIEELHIKTAYPYFSVWAQGLSITDDENGFKWYIHPVEGKVSNALSE